MYYLHAFYPNGSGTTLFPAYRGKLWLNQSNNLRVSKTAIFENCYSVGHAVERSKLGLDWALGLGLASLGLPQGNIRSWDFRRMS